MKKWLKTGKNGSKFFLSILPDFSHFFVSYFDVLGSIFEKCAMTDLPNVIVSMCLVSYNFCMIPHVCSLTFGLNLSGAWGGSNNKLNCQSPWLILYSFFTVKISGPSLPTTVVLADVGACQGENACLTGVPLLHWILKLMIIRFLSWPRSWRQLR